MEKKPRDQVETFTQVETSSSGEFQAKWVEGAHAATPLVERWVNVKQ